MDNMTERYLNRILEYNISGTFDLYVEEYDDYEIDTYSGTYYCGNGTLFWCVTEIISEFQKFDCADVLEGLLFYISEDPNSNEFCVRTKNKNGVYYIRLVRI